MATSRSSGPQVVCFGVYEADLRSGELRKSGLRVRLPEQPFQVLAILLEHPGEVVTRESLQKRLWPHGTFVDFEQGLNTAVKRLREVLDDSAETPRLIETLPRRGYRFIGSLAAKPGRIESLAVLPLENLSRDPEQDYFAEGMTEALITSLAKIGALRVVSRTSVMQYKGIRKSLRDIALELQVDGVVEGTVQRSGERLRISAQLVHASTDTHLWAESYDRDLRDVLALQSEVARAIAREVQVKLTPFDQARFAHVHPVDPEAYDAYLQGRYHWNRRTGEGLQHAVQYFEQAIAKDPAYGAAYAGLADCLSTLGWWGFLPPNEVCGKAKGMARQALELDPSLAEAHASLAFANMADYDYRAAEAGFERSIELNPRYATAREWFGFYLGLMGRYEEAYAEFKRAIRLDPISIIIHTMFGFVQIFGRRYDRAIEQAEKTLALDPNFAVAHGTLGWANVYKSLHEPAIAALRKTVELSHGAPLYIAWLGEAYASAGEVDEARKILNQLDELSKQRYVTPFGIGRIYAALGEKDEAFRWLEAAYRKRDMRMSFLKTDPGLDNLRSDPRFQDLMRRMNFVEAG
jgi:TolB-like protein/Flp pilus assembly protein TadD